MSPDQTENLLKFDCPDCGTRLEAPVELAGQSVACPACQKVIRAPRLEGGVAQSSASARDARLCAICQTAFADSDSKVSCPGCNAEYHADCWEENGGCAIYGCSQVPPTEGRKSIEIPVAYWGQENKPCPVCNAQILAAAVRCRHCGTVFQTARPLDSTEYSHAASWEARLPKLRKGVIWLAVLSLLPFTAPVGITVLFFWAQSRREGIDKLPSLYSALITIGLLVGTIETVGLVLVAVIFSLTHL
jgi:hypothetical protein